MSDEKSTPASPEPNPELTSEPASGVEPTRGAEPTSGAEPTRSFPTSYAKDAPTTPATRVLPEDEAGDPERSELTTGPSLSETDSPASVSLSKDSGDDAPAFGTAGFDETRDADRYDPEPPTPPTPPTPPSPPAPDYPQAYPPPVPGYGAPVPGAEHRDPAPAPNEVTEPRKVRMRTVVLGLVLLVIAGAVLVGQLTDVTVNAGSILLALMIGGGLLLIAGARRT